MSAKIRLVLGFLLGLILSALAFFLAGIGHGTYAPMVANSSIFAFVPVLGFFIAPLQWAIYYLVIPEIDSRVKRVVALALIVLLHLIPGAWMANEDPAFLRELNSHPIIVLLHSAILLLAIGGLSVFSGSKGHRYP